MATLIENEMLKFINLARQFPAYYISLIDKQLLSFTNEREMPIGDDVIYETNQGKSAWKEARVFLQKQTSMPALQVYECLSYSAKDHATDLARSGIFGHTGSDKSTFSQRILRHCRKGQGSMAQIIGADFLIKGRNNAELTVLGLIIDDGVSDRGHRKTIFSLDYRYIGCKSEVQNDKLITVFNLTENKLVPKGNISSNSGQQANHNQFSSTLPDYRNKFAPEENGKFNFSKTNPTPSPVLGYSPRVSSPIDRSNRSPFNQMSKNEAPSKFQQSLGEGRSSSSPFKGGKKIKEKTENCKTYYVDGCKVTQNTVQLFFSDGTVEQNIEKHTYYQ